VRVAFTGGTGFLGTHLRQAWAQDAELVDIQGDVRDAATFEKTPRADVAYHLAAISNVPQGIRDPWGTWSTNADGTFRFLEWARRADVGRVVLVSSGQVYGRIERSPVDESAPTMPVSPYAASKLAGEALLQAYGAAYGLKGVVVRPFNMYGPGQSRTFLVAEILHQLAERGRAELGDPEPIRDYTYVGDAVEMLRLAATVPAAVGRTFNMGTGEGTSVRQLADLALHVTGAPGPVTFDPARRRPSEIPRLVVDARRARKILGWTPAVPLAEGLRRTWLAIEQGL
jgi:nucleoside-diphosphate-sugar epimerase